MAIQFAVLCFLLITWLFKMGSKPKCCSLFLIAKRPYGEYAYVWKTLSRCELPCCWLWVQCGWANNIYKWDTFKQKHVYKKAINWSIEMLEPEMHRKPVLPAISPKTNDPVSATILWNMMTMKNKPSLEWQNFSGGIKHASLFKIASSRL